MYLIIIRSSISISLKEDIQEIIVIKRISSDKNRQAFLASIAETDWVSVTEEMNTQLSFTAFHKKYLELYNIHFPKIRTKSQYNSRKPWLSLELRDAIKNKNKLY